MIPVIQDQFFKKNTGEKWKDVKAIDFDIGR